MRLERSSVRFSSLSSSDFCRDGQNTGAVRELLETELREFSFELVYDKVDFIVIPFVTHGLPALLQLRTGFKGHVADQDLSSGVQMLPQDAQEEDLLCIRQMMQGVSRHDEIIALCLKRLHQSLCEIALIQMCIGHLFRSQLDHSC